MVCLFLAVVCFAHRLSRFFCAFRRIYSFICKITKLIMKKWWGISEKWMGVKNITFING